MDRIWAPWRMDYVESSKKPGCVFCQKSQSIKDKKNLVLYRGMETFILMNLYPYTNGHLMIAPYLHTSDVNELTESANKEIMQFAKDCFNILKSKLGAEGFNFGVNLINFFEIVSQLLPKYFFVYSFFAKYIQPFLIVDFSNFPTDPVQPSKLTVFKAFCG